MIKIYINKNHFDATDKCILAFIPTVEKKIVDCIIEINGFYRYKNDCILLLQENYLLIFCSGR